MRGRRSGRIALLLISIPISFAAFVLGHIVAGGWDSADTQCSYLPGEPPITIEIHGESGMTENGRFSPFPFGVICEFEDPGDGIPPQDVLYPNWSATIFFVLSIAGVAAGVMLMVPLRRQLHREPHERWVRFHSLPHSKRYADTDDERAEILARHHAVLDRLRQGELVVTPRNSRPLDELLLSIADDEYPGELVIGDASKEWRYYPYDGGADVIARSQEERDALAAEFAPWLSARDDGL